MISIPTRCSECDEVEYMPYTCKFCGEEFCAEHRLPENHSCSGLSDYRAKLRSQGKIMDPKTGDRGGEVGFVEKYLPFLSYFKGNVALLLLGLIFVAYLVQIVLRGIDPMLELSVFFLGPDFVERPWSIITSMFAHGNEFHLFVNAIVLFFFGPELERRVGSRRLLEVYLVAGVIGGLAHVVFMESYVVGASGAIFGVFGALTMLAPNMRIFLIVIPMKLWVATVIFVILNVAMIGQGPIASLAHLGGLGIGLLYGLLFKNGDDQKPKSDLLSGGRKRY
ncbi:rhomboid family intramembrane serine protease [Methanonatronarchaeum sp. AMET-Sl]|uniref:rhomboid family intramembrane serine protease n=1 Tax=Methanonatronarchaeum sp. AMET-Sl TaxID=3037654 RepID=UPI00244E063D|nr:rhomboid family intramembrane serine protease [Methanonatronarchaeum sp. AMET-Sl]WGI18035.1 rhomboid family intramembrane serine protease [Methanonatronarchaeum sp. AMET-Sl]